MSEHIYDLAKSKMGGEKHKKAKKEVREIRTRKGKSGGYIHEHHFTHPEDHPTEEHTTPDQDAMMAHMAANMPDAGGAAPAGDPAAAVAAAGGGAAPVPAPAGPSPETA